MLLKSALTTRGLRWMAVAKVAAPTALGKDSQLQLRTVLPGKPRLRGSSAKHCTHKPARNELAIAGGASLNTSGQDLSRTAISPVPRPEHEVKWLEVVKGLVVPVALSGVVLASHSFGNMLQLAGALAVALLLGIHGYRRRSLSQSGSLMAVALGFAMLSCSLRAGATLLAFYFSSSKLTQLGEQSKNVDEEFKAGGRRDWKQVACNAALPALLTVTAAYFTGMVDAPLSSSGALGRASAATAGFLGYMSCCCGDTWASELGQLSASTPRLITSMRPVQKGTNGGVTPLGLGASMMGGLFIGVVFYLTGLASPSLRAAGHLQAATAQRIIIPLGFGAGMFGSILDSYLGATLQYSGFNHKTGKITAKAGPGVSRISGWALLDNNGVNLVSATTTSALTAFVAMKLI